MYRCLTYGILKHHVNLDDLAALTEFLKNFNFDIKIKLGDKKYFFEGEDVSEKIRLGEVTSNVSRVSAIKEVREKLVALQRHHAIGVNAIFEGRDMGTVVFPNADIKVFLTGDPQVRAQRRFDELRAKFPLETKDLSLEQTLDEIIKRDAYDTNREISPLKKAEDALVIDTSHLNVGDIVFQILEFKDTLKTRRPPSV
jgi:cytidylate kinase